MDVFDDIDMADDFAHHEDDEEADDEGPGENPQQTAKFEEESEKASAANP